MQPPAIPVDDPERVAAVRALGLLDTPPEERFDRITRTAARVFDVPIALINLVDVDRQWGKSCVGIAGSEAERSISLCAHAINEVDALVVPDARVDPRFADNPVVARSAGMVFYAGQPLRGLGGYAVGTLCIADHVPRTLDAREREVLRDLAHWAESELEAVELGEALERVREAERRLHVVMDAVPDGVLTCDEADVVRSANPAAAQVLGRPPEELRGRAVPELLGRDGAALMAALREGRGSPTASRGEVQVRTADGREVPVELAVCTGEHRGRPFSVVVVRDVSARRAAEVQIDRLRRSNARILAAAAGGIIAVDRAGVVESVNPAGAVLLGTAVEDVVGRSLHDLAHHTREDGTPYPWEDCPTLATLRDGAARHVADEVFWRADGSPFHAEYATSPIVEDGAIVGAVVTLADISERLEVERVKSEFVAVVSHELRTPLTSIKGSLGLVAGGAFGEVPVEARRMVDIALANSDRLVRLINDVLDLERIDAGQMAVDPRPVDLAVVVADAVDAVRGSALVAGVRLVVIPPPPARLLADPDRVVQALANLLGNAVKFSDAGGEVRLDATVADGEAVVRVADRGRGIPADLLARVFERFVQVDASDAREQGGTGLGLAIVRAIAEQHGGRVWVESASGAGSTFSLALPLAAAASAVGEDP